MNSATPIEVGETLELNISGLDLKLCIFDQHKSNDCLYLCDYPNITEDNEVFTIIKKEYLNSTFIHINRTRASSTTDSCQVCVHSGTLLFATKGICTVEEDINCGWQHIVLLEAYPSSSSSAHPFPSPSTRPQTSPAARCNCAGNQMKEITPKSVYIN